MTAGGIVATVSRLGGTIEPLEDDRLRIRPKSMLAPNLLAALQREKPGVLMLLRLLHGGALNEYAGDVLGFESEPTADELLAEVERHGAVLYIRPQGDLGIRHGERVSDGLLLTLARAHLRLLEALEKRSGAVLPSIREARAA